MKGRKIISMHDLPHNDFTPLSRDSLSPVDNILLNMFSALNI